MNGAYVDKNFIGDLARKLADVVPGTDSLATMRADMERNFRGLLDGAFERLDLVSREEFDRQRKVLERTREKVTALESRLDELETRLKPGPSE
jgi:BMFP domain-containing protein YqiC